MVSDKLRETIKVLVTCNLCGLQDFPVQVESRLPEEDVVNWMHKTQEAVGKAHFNKSPHCTAKTLTNVKIPLNKDDTYIGAPIEDA